MVDHDRFEDGWMGVDFDGTLAQYDGKAGADEMGEPIPLMVMRVRKWIAEGKDVRVFIARVNPDVGDGSEEERKVYVSNCLRAIEGWCLKHLGKILPVTHQKDFQMIESYDDRAVTVERNTGKILTMGREFDDEASDPIGFFLDG